MTQTEKHIYTCISLCNTHRRLTQGEEGEDPLQYSSRLEPPYHRNFNWSKFNHCGWPSETEPSLETYRRERQCRKQSSLSAMRSKSTFILLLLYPIPPFFPHILSELSPQGVD